MNRVALVAALISLVPLGCSAGGGTSHSLVVGNDGSGGGAGSPSGSGGSPVILTSDAGLSTALSAHVESPPGMTVTFVTLSCSNECADVLAVAKGGFEPYDFTWEDGSKSAERTVCATSTTAYEVTVTDSGSSSGEFTQKPQTARAPLTAKVVHCPDDGGTVHQDAGAVRQDSGACSAAAASVLPETLVLDVTGPIRYFANGASLPRGRYRVEYVDGCMMYGPPTMYGLAAWGWDIHTGTLPINFWLSGFPDAGYCVLVGSSESNIVGVLPGTTNGDPGYATYAACVAANKAAAVPLDFDFAGGRLGMVVEDHEADDNVGGESQGGVSPTWKLSLLAACP